MVKNDCETKDKFFDQKDILLEQIKEYQFFSNGRYLTLAIFALIIKKCEYLGPIMESGVFIKKEFIKNSIVRKWLKTVLDELIKKEYDSFTREIGVSTISFYGRTPTWENITTKFDRLRYSFNQEFKDIFPLNLSKI